MVTTIGSRPLNVNSPFFHEQRAGRNFDVQGQVAVCGCGALGANIAENLARMGFQHLLLVDDSSIEARNLSTQPFVEQQVGLSKAGMLAAWLYQAVGCRAKVVQERIVARNARKFLDGSCLIVDTFDNGASREVLQRQFCNSSFVPFGVLHVGFSGDGYGEVRWGEGYAVPHEEVGADPCDYPAARPFILTLAAVATETIADWFLHRRQRSWCVLYHDGCLRIEMI